MGLFMLRGTYALYAGLTLTIPIKVAFCITELIRKDYALFKVSKE